MNEIVKNASSKGALKSKTMRFAALLAVLGQIQANSEQLQALLTPEVYGWITFIIAFVVAGLRAATTTSLAEK